MSNYSKNKKVSISSVIAIILGILLVVSVFISTGTICWGWFSDNESATDTTAAADESNNLVVNDAGGSGISLAMTALSGSNELGATVYSGTTTINGESVDYESSYEVTATVDDEATDRTITWTLSCSGISNISSYVVLSSDTSEDGESITVYCLQAFSKQITLTATCGNVTATCTLDYVARISNYYLYNMGYGYDYDEAGDGESEECYLNDYFLNSSNTSWITIEGTAGKLLSMRLSSSSDYSHNYDCIFSDYDITTVTGYYYGTGSVKEEFSNPVYTITLDSTVAEALGVTTNTYTVTDWVISVDDILNSMFGVSNAMSQTSYKSKVYNVCQSYYTSRTAIFTVSVNATGSITGESYTFDYSVYCDMSGYNVPATSVSLDNTELYF